MFTKYEHSKYKNTFEPVFSKWRGDNWSCVSSKRASDPGQFTAAADGVGVDRNSLKFDGMCMKGLSVNSHVKFYNDLSAGSKNLQRKPQNFGDNWPLASILWTKGSR